MHLETNLSKIKHLSSVNEDVNFRFRTFLKGQDSTKVDNIVHRLHEEITKQIDCTLCGNCCNQLSPKLHKDDIAVLAQLENISPGKYMDDYCEKGDFEEIYLKTIPCRYLEGKKCGIYENRPDKLNIFHIQIKRDLYQGHWECWDFMKFARLFSI